VVEQVGSREERVGIEGVEFLATLTLGSEVGVLALHGSKEGGTAELAYEVAARTGASCLVFTQPAGDPVHIPSHRMSAAHSTALRDFLAHVTLTVSLHGHFRRSAPRSIFLGGTNREAAHTLRQVFAREAPDFDPVTALPDIPSGLRGLHPRNPVNLTAEGGVQLELPLAARTQGPRTSPGAPDVPPATVTTALTTGVRLLLSPGTDGTTAAL
jgi:phage replication-related protein YjqB (UPF0714/DUF867 family)